MPWRSRPQAAFATGLLWASPLLAVEGFFCAQLLRDGGRADPAMLSCAEVRADRWSLLPGVEYTGRLAVELAPRPGGAMTLLIGDRVAPDVEIEQRRGAPLPLQTTPVVPLTQAPPDYWLEFGSPWSAPPHVLLATIEALPAERRTAVLNLGRRAPRVLARLKGYGDEARGRVCAAAIEAPVAFVRHRELVISAADEAYFASGWLEERGPRRAPSRALHDRAIVLVPSARTGNVRVRLLVSAWPEDGHAPPQLLLTVNDLAELAGSPIDERTYEWRLSATAWVKGTNELMFSVADPRARVGVERIELVLE